MSSRQIEEWIVFKTIEAEDEKKAYDDAAKPKPGNTDSGDDDEE